MTADGSAKPHWWNAPAEPKTRWYSVPEKRAVVFAILAACATAVPVVLVNITSVIGQFAYLRVNVPWPVIGLVLIAVSIESIAVYLAWNAHRATMANDSALRLKLAAYLFALAIGLVNYSHYAHHWHPTPLAVIMLISSASSPWLWGVHTRRVSRDKLMELNQLDPHSVRLGGARWTWHPLRSIRATSWAAWHGVNHLPTVMAHFASRYGTEATPEPPRVPRRNKKDGTRRNGEKVHVGTEPWIGTQSVPAPATDGQAAFQDATLIPGTVLNGSEFGPQPAVHVAEVPLEAHGRMGGHKHPPQDIINRTREWLFGLPDEEILNEKSRVCSVRAIAASTEHGLGDPNQRRLASELKDEAVAAARQRAQLRIAGNGHARPNAQSLLIPAPSAFLPGGGM